jgi:hypothetical protein
MNKKHYRFTEISGWHRIRDEENNELGAGNSQEEALNDCIDSLVSAKQEYKLRATRRIKVINKQQKEIKKLRNAFRLLYAEAVSQVDVDCYDRILDICKSVGFDNVDCMFEDE